MCASAKVPNCRNASAFQELAVKIDSAWLAVVSRLPVENCRKAREKTSQRDSGELQFLCDRRWDEMRLTNSHHVRRCTECDEDVQYCINGGQAFTIAAAGHCIVIDLAVRRRPYDLQRTDPPQG